MYLMYVDESGDIGKVASPTRYFLLTGMIIHELRWKNILDGLVQLRTHFKTTKGLKLNEEIHATEFLHTRKKLKSIKRNDRIDILKQCMDWLANQPDLAVISICVDKTKCSRDPFEVAWEALINRFENTIRHKNFPGPSNPDDKGLLLPDNTDGKKLTQLLRKMRKYNIVPNRADLYGGGFRNFKIEYIIEDPFLKDSRTSYFHQMTDVVVYSARQLYEPNRYLTKKGGKNFYKRIEPIIVKAASKTHPLGIVEL